MSLRKIYILTILLCSVWSVSRANAQSLAEQAGMAYQKGDYAKAVELYEQSGEQDGTSAAYFYNLGNAYYKCGRYPDAILNYERAALLDPGSSDVRFNLELAHSKTIDKITPESEMFFVTWYKNIIDMMSMDGWARTGIVAFVLACVLILVFFLGNKVVWKKLGFFGALVMLAVVVMANVFAWTQHQELNARSGAVVMSSSVVVKSTPNESGTDLFVLHEGTRVEIIDDSMKEWKEIRLADGKVGWMPTEAMEVI